jgi:hypothetical protein
MLITCAFLNHTHITKLALRGRTRFFIRHAIIPILRGALRQVKSHLLRHLALEFSFSKEREEVMIELQGQSS